MGRLAREIMDLRIPNQQVSVFLDRWVQKNFRSEGGSVGGWTPFKRGGRWIPGKGLDKSAKLLQHTGVLRASFHPFFDKRRAGIRSRLSYARPHQYGAPSRNLPARRMIPDHGEADRDVVRIHERFVGLKTRRPLW